jgi:hypothetical protein
MRLPVVQEHGNPGGYVAGSYAGTGRWPRAQSLIKPRGEGMNRFVKQVKRAACGFRNRANYRRQVRSHSINPGLEGAGPKHLSPGHNLHDSVVWSLSFGLKRLSKSPPLVSLPG